MKGSATGNLDMIKKLNRSLVLEMIREHEEVTRAQIANTLNISRSTVSTIVDELIQKKLVTEHGPGTSTKLGGRKGIVLRFNPKSAFGIGVDIGGTKVLVLITTLDGEVVYKKKFKTSASVEEILSIIETSIEEAAIIKNDIVAMGVGVPSIVEEQSGVVLDAYALGWTNLPLKQILEERFSFPIFINNDVNFAAVGEAWMGSGEQSENVLFIAIGTGVGSAIISNGKLLRGAHNQAGEIAYSVSEEDVKSHNYNEKGKFGTFERKTSGKFLSHNELSAAEVFSKYLEGDEDAQETVETFIRHLSIQIANSVSLLNPEYVVLGGGVSESLKEIIPRIQEAVELYTPIPTTIKLATLGGEAGSYGAIAYAFKEIEMADIKDNISSVQ